MTQIILNRDPFQLNTARIIYFQDQAHGTRRTDPDLNGYRNLIDRYKVEYFQNYSNIFKNFKEFFRIKRKRKQKKTKMTEAKTNILQKLEENLQKKENKILKICPGKASISSVALRAAGSAPRFNCFNVGSINAPPPFALRS